MDNHEFHSKGAPLTKRIKQVISFDGMRLGTITPTDIDGCIEYHDKALVLLEYKLRGYGMPFGQRLCLERIANDVEMAGREATVMLCEHDVTDVNKPVEGKDASVKAIYYKHQWHKSDGKSVQYHLERFKEYVDRKGALS